MKKIILFGCLILITACQSVTPTPQIASTATNTALPTQPEPATATITFTPAPTFTPTPVPLYFTDEFSAPTIDAWTSFQTGGESTPTLAFANDQLSVSISSPNTWYYAIHNAHEYTNVNVSAKFNGMPTGSLGVICRYSESGWYEYDVASDGTYTVLLGQWLADGIASYLPIANDSTEYLRPGSLDYEITLGCKENTLSLYINGKLFRNLNVTRYGLTEGKAGISISSIKEPMSGTFDWFKLSEPE
ncbi:MAG: hypothetical protein U0Z26_05250 [Anaerolineales bacterium]